MCGSDVPDVVRQLREAAPVIREEFDAVRKSNTLPNDYSLKDGEAALHTSPGQQATAASSTSPPSWEWHSYVQKGRRRPDFALQCPRTVDVLEQLPGFMTGTPFSYTFFSVMQPRQSIMPHFGPTNARLRVHLPLYVPPDCGIRVGTETREWHEGEPLVFDDSFEHEVWNRHEHRERSILLIDLWHPDLTLGERLDLVAMFDDARRQGWIS